MSRIMRTALVAGVIVVLWVVVTVVAVIDDMVIAYGDDEWPDELGDDE